MTTVGIIVLVAVLAVLVWRAPTDPTDDGPM